jgi:hypothetical protein
MNGGLAIVEMRATEAFEEIGAGVTATGPEPVAEWVEPQPEGNARASWVGWSVVALSLVWVGALVFLARDSFAAMTPLALAQFGAAAATVPALAGIVWLASLRTSGAEARRFATSAHRMRAEAQALESTVAVLGEQIEERRQQLAEQIRLLTALGDAATNRLASIGRHLSEEIDTADIHARALTSAAETAQAKLDTLIATMPRAGSETEALTQALERAGLTAGERTAALDAQVAALAARGREAETIAGGAAEKLAAHIARMDATGEAAGARLEMVTQDAAAAVDALMDRTAAAIDESRKAIAAQGDAMLAMVGANQSALDQAARESAEALAERINVIEIVIERIAQRLDHQRETGRALFDELEVANDRVERRFAGTTDAGAARVQQLAASISALEASAEAMARSLASGSTAAERSIATAETLLTALDAAVREMDETIPDAVERLESRVGQSRAVVTAAKPELLALVTAAESTHDAIEAVAQVVADQRRQVDALTGSLATGREKADDIGASVEHAVQQANALSEQAAPRLVEALLRVRDTAAQAADHARETLARVIPEAAEALEHAGVAALQRATEHGVEAQVAQVATIAETAVNTASRAAERLDRQLQGIEATIALVDQRLEEAREEREETDSFARRASLLIEALNSASIDLTRTFAPEISDSAWAAYLKGDRGVFTRRAVRLLDGSEQKDVLRLYDDDAAFREQVNRYIHDFEAMLRTILAQRDASPLGVTLLSSDMGKLYVALAQAIDRLR